MLGKSIPLIIFFIGFNLFINKRLRIVLGKQYLFIRFLSKTLIDIVFDAMDSGQIIDAQRNRTDDYNKYRCCIAAKRKRINAFCRTCFQKHILEILTLLASFRHDFLYETINSRITEQLTFPRNNLLGFNNHIVGHLLVHEIRKERNRRTDDLNRIAYRGVYELLYKLKAFEREVFYHVDRQQWQCKYRQNNEPFLTEQSVFQLIDVVDFINNIFLDTVEVRRKGAYAVFFCIAVLICHVNAGI